MGVIAYDKIAVEPTEFQDIFCCGLHRIEFIASCARFVFFNQTGSAGQRVNVVMPIAIVLPISAVLPAVKMAEAEARRRIMPH